MRLSTLFTLSKNRAAHNQRPQAARQIPVFHREPRVKAPECPGAPKPPECQSPRNAKATEVVEPDGIEPTTSCLQSRRSPS